MIEKAEGNYSAYVPDLLGCTAVGDTLEEVEEGMQEEGLPIPEPTSCQ